LELKDQNDFLDMLLNLEKSLSAKLGYSPCGSCAAFCRSLRFQRASAVIVSLVGFKFN